MAPARDNEAPERRIVHYQGRVQGVGFRYTTRSIARRYKVTGYVQNLDDGRVELLAEGQAPEIDAFLREVHDYFFNNIRQEQSTVQSASGQYTTFDIRH